MFGLIPTASAVVVFVWSIWAESACPVPVFGLAATAAIYRVSQAPGGIRKEKKTKGRYALIEV